MRIPRINSSEITGAVTSRREFNASAVSARKVDGVLFDGPGRLKGDDLTAFKRDRASIVYVVMSYETPIYWVTGDGVVHKVAQKFSATTSRHQGRMP